MGYRSELQQDILIRSDRIIFTHVIENTKNTRHSKREREREQELLLDATNHNMSSTNCLLLILRPLNIFYLKVPYHMS